MEADVWIDALPKLVRQGNSSTVEWGSVASDSCTVSWAGTTVSNSLAGRVSAENITGQRTYTVTCAMLGGGTKSDEVTINLVPVWQEI